MDIRFICRDRHRSKCKSFIFLRSDSIHFGILYVFANIHKKNVNSMEFDNGAFASRKAPILNYCDMHSLSDDDGVGGVHAPHIRSFSISSYTRPQQSLCDPSAILPFTFCVDNCCGICKNSGPFFLHSTFCRLQNNNSSPITLFSACETIRMSCRLPQSNFHLGCTVPSETPLPWIPGLGHGQLVQIALAPC